MAELTQECLLKILDERDRRYEQRFVAQQEAMRLAFDSQRELVSSALTAADRAVTKAEAASEKRFEGLNEFRETLADQQKNLLPRAEYLISQKAFEDRLSSYERRTVTSEGEKKGSQDTFSVILALLAVAVSLFAVFHK